MARLEEPEKLRESLADEVIAAALAYARQYQSWVEGETDQRDSPTTKPIRAVVLSILHKSAAAVRSAERARIASDCGAYIRDVGPMEFLQNYQAIIDPEKE